MKLFSYAILVVCQSVSQSVCQSTTLVHTEISHTAAVRWIAMKFYTDLCKDVLIDQRPEPDVFQRDHP